VISVRQDGTDANRRLTVVTGAVLLGLLAVDVGRARRPAGTWFAAGRQSVTAELGAAL